MKIEFQFPLLIVKADASFFERFKKYKKQILLLSNIFVIVSFIGFIFATLYLLSSLKDLLFPSKEFVPAVIPLIPGVEIMGIKLPLVEGLIAIFIAATIHELSHGAVLAALGRKIKSWGFFLLGPLGGAFVEPDEEDLKRETKWNRIRVYAAGPAVNIILGILFLGLANLLFPQFNQFKCLKVLNTTNPVLEKYNVSCIYGINGKNFTSLEQFQTMLYHHKPGQNITLITDKGNITITLRKNPKNESKPFIGVVIIPEYIKKGFYFLYSLIGVLGVVNLGIGLANLIPMFITDGGQMLREFVNERVWRAISLFFIGIVLANIIMAILL